MKKYLYIFSFILNIIFVISFFFFYTSFKVANDFSEVKSVVSTEHNSIVNDVALNVIFSKIDSNFNLILTTITVLFALFVFLTFFGVKEQFDFRVSKLRKMFEKQSELLNKYKTDLLSIKGDLSFEVAEKIEKDIKELNILGKENPEYKDFVKHIELVLISCDYFSQSLIHKKDIYPKYKSSVTNLIKGNLSDTAQLLSSTVNFELDNIGYESFLRLQDNIHKVADLEDKQNLASIFSKLSFPSLD